VLTLDSALEFNAARDEEFFASLPAKPAVCLIELKQPSARPFLIRTQDLRRRLQRLLSPQDPPSKRLNLRDIASRIHYRISASAFEQTFAYYQLARSLFSDKYVEMLRIRPPAVLKVNLRNAYPRCYSTRKLSIDANGGSAGGVYYGPFPSRKSADAFAERVLDLFKVRRCQIKIRRDPSFPGCIYSEMKMCLAPCFAGCTKEEYDFEIQRLVSFLETGGASLRESLEAERNRASEDLDFEKASSLHKKLDKLDDTLRGQPELPRRLEDLNAVIFQRGVADQSIDVYEVRAGKIAEPFQLCFATLAGDPRSAEQLLRQHIEKSVSDAVTASGIPPAPRLEGGKANTSSVIPSGAIEDSDARGKNLPGSSLAARHSNPDLSEHLWLLARWFYSNPREGEIFFRANAWPYRRMMRACARLLAPSDSRAATPQKSSPAQPGPERETT
jgi:excinuclease ABC subunit C